MLQARALEWSQIVFVSTFASLGFEFQTLIMILAVPCRQWQSARGSCRAGQCAFDDRCCQCSCISIDLDLAFQHRWIKKGLVTRRQISHPRSPKSGTQFFFFHVIFILKKHYVCAILCLYMYACLCEDRLFMKVCRCLYICFYWSPWRFWHHVVPVGAFCMIGFKAIKKTNFSSFFLDVVLILFGFQLG